MSLLRRANHRSELIVESYSAQYKTRIWGVSQNIDRVAILSWASPSACVRLARREAVPSHSRKA
jgi:hypothetical protein